MLSPRAAFGPEARRPSRAREEAVRPTVRIFVQDAAENLPIADPIVEIGSRPAEGQEQEANLRSYFAGRTYIGCDAVAGPNVDQVEDIHSLSFADDSVGTVVCVETLEHVADPHRGVREIHRVLKPGGVAILTSVMFLTIHETPDYWRFTPDGFALLLAPFETSLTFGFGHELLPEGIHGIGVKGPFPNLTRARLPRIDDACRRWGQGMPVDMGPIRMTISQLWRFTARSTLDAARRGVEGARKRPR
jgi:SAM-dependent methyltransferase